MSSFNKQTDWCPPPPHQTLSPDEVHVWRINLNQPAPTSRRLSALLNADETSRANRFHFPAHRDRFIVGRGVLRLVLSRYLNQEPHEIDFQYSDYGKPFLGGMDGGSGLGFNLAHSHDMGLYAVTLGREIGIDIEYQRADMAGDQIAERFFAPEEIAALRALPVERRTQGFFNCWTRKEAYIKARGEGLSFPLAGFTVSLAPGEPAALLNVADSPEESSKWFMCELVPGPGYAAAIAVKGHGWKLTQWDANDLLSP